MEDVFRALADPTRRQILDALFECDGQSLTALCEQIPQMTRFGVMKHLSVLAQAHLVTTRRDGREKFHYLNPVPIAEIHNRWVSKYASPFVSALASLKGELEHDLEHDLSVGAADNSNRTNLDRTNLDNTPPRARTA